MVKQNGDKKWESPNGLILFGLGSAFTAIGLYIWHIHPSSFEHQRKDQRIENLQKEITQIRGYLTPRMCIEIIEATWQNHKKNNSHGYIWRPNNRSEGIGKTNIHKDHKNFPLFQSYFERINSHKTNLALVEANKHSLGNSSWGTKKVLNFKYRCWGFDEHTRTYNVPLVYHKKGEEKDHIDMEINEDEHHYVECKENEWRRKV